MNSYTYGTDITINGNLEINSTITFASESKITVYGNVKVGKNGVLDMRNGGTIEIHGNLEFKSITDHSGLVPKAAIVLCDGLKALKEQGLLSAISVTLKNYDKYCYHFDKLLYTSNELSKSEMQRIQLALVKLLEGKWYETEVLSIHIKMNLRGGIPMKKFSYFDSKGNLQHFRLGIEKCAVVVNGKGEVGSFEITYARGDENPQSYTIYQEPDVAQDQVNACYRAIAYEGFDSIKEIQKCLSGDIAQDAAIFIVTQMADVIGNKSIPEAFSSFDKKYKKYFLDVIEG